MKPALSLPLTSLLLALALPGCAALKTGDSPTTMRLSPRFGPAGLAAAIPSFAVTAVRARGATGALRYAYVDAAAPSEIRQAATLFWEESPTEIVAHALVAGLRSRFATVTGPDIALPADRRVIATLDRFEEAVGSGSAQAVVAFDVTQLSQGKAIGAGRYCATRPIASASGTDRALAFQGAIEDAVRTLVQDVATGSTTAPPC